MHELAKHMQEMFEIDKGRSYAAAFITMIFFFILLIAVCFLLWKLLQKINHKIFRKLEEKNGRSMSRDFLERIISVLITFCFILIPFNWDDIGQSVFGSAAVLAAVIGFAAQDVIKDILAGIQMSIYKPFDIGDRIEADEGISGIVEKITMRHVVIKRIDTIRIIIPNSKLNELSVMNYSYNDVPRSVMLTFPISYTSDIQKAKEIISEVVRESPLSIPRFHLPDGTMGYSPVYFIELSDSALIMSVTIHFDHDTPTERVRDDINTAVFQALTSNGIEIPYNYVNVVMKSNSQAG